MPRPSLKEQRSREILDAFVTCAARYGLEGATQERIAQEANVKRTLLRHYLGNKEDMVSALCDHVVGEFDALTEALGATLAESSDATELVDLLFDTNNQTDPRLVLVFQSLTASVTTYPAMRTELLSSMEGLITLIATYLRRLHPKRTSAERHAVAHGVAALYMTADVTAPLQPPAAWRKAQIRAANALLTSLKD